MLLKKLLEESEKKKHEEHEQATKIIVDLKLQVEEATRIKEVMNSQLKMQKLRKKI